MVNKFYELLEHTADIRVRITGSGLRELFKNAAFSLFEIMAEKEQEAGKRTAVKITQKADFREELFVNWLNELLSLSAARGLIFSDFKINKLQDNKLEALAYGEPIENYRVNSEIKAATYHELKILETSTGWQAEVIFDV